MMSVEMIGGVYCPLSSHDPEHRLHSLVEQTQSRLVLVHSLTKTKFNHHIVSFDVDLIVDNNNVVLIDVDIDRLSNIIVTSKNICYTIFTSGSTGTPKAVC
jgi:non-ribosomal peptide synthetase component F